VDAESHLNQEDPVKRTTSKTQVAWMGAVAGVLAASLSAFGMEPGDMTMGRDKGAMMQEEPMSADALIKKGEELIAQGTAMKKKGMMMKEQDMKKGGVMKKDDMMKHDDMSDHMK
jgi:hypothetical protein